MKTTIEIPDTLMAQARSHAAARNMTLKALIEQGLRTVLAEKPEPFRLRDGSVNGQGMAAEFRNASWGQLRDFLYDPQ